MDVRISLPCPVGFLHALTSGLAESGEALVVEIEDDALVLRPEGARPAAPKPTPTPAATETRPARRKGRAPGDYACEICGAHFDTAQGLGGHKGKRHRNGTARATEPEETKPPVSFESDPMERRAFDPDAVRHQQADVEATWT